MNGNDSALLGLPGAVIDTMKAPKDDPEVNYRYAADPQRSCGMCVNFSPPGKCAIVMGVIRSVDTCNLFEPAPNEGRIVADLIPGQVAEDEAEEPEAPKAPVHAKVVLHVPQRVPVQSELRQSPVQAELVGPGTLRQVQAELAEGFGPQQPKSGNLADHNFSDNKEGGPGSGVYPRHGRWSDAARAASALARKHGFTPDTGRVPPYRNASTYNHQNGDMLHITSAGSWQHTDTVGNPKGSGDDAASLHQHLSKSTEAYDAHAAGHSRLKGHWVGKGGHVRNLADEADEWVTIKGKSMQKGSEQHKAALAELEKGAVA